jgi:hypothetical protein
MTKVDCTIGIGQGAGDQNTAFGLAHYVTHGVRWNTLHHAAGTLQVLENGAVL